MIYVHMLLSMPNLHLFLLHMLPLLIIQQVFLLRLFQFFQILILKLHFHVKFYLYFLLLLELSLLLLQLYLILLILLFSLYQ